MSIRNMDGPIVEKNMADFEELKELQNEFARQLQVYNQSVKQLIDESRDYISSSSRANNQFANTYLKDPAGGVAWYPSRCACYASTRPRRSWSSRTSSCRSPTSCRAPKHPHRPTHSCRLACPRRGACHRATGPRTRRPP